MTKILHTARAAVFAVLACAAAAEIDAAETKKPTKKAKEPATAKVGTLEDFYGDSGTRFQAAIGFYNTEPIGSTISPNVSGYGIGVDDMFISWRETRLDEDTTSCAAGECADIEMKSTLSYDSADLVEITITDKSPYDPVNPKNDCDGNGSYLDAIDDQDCNDNGATDVTVRLSSLAEPTGEIVALDRTAPGSPVYRARFPYTTTSDVPGSLFIQREGTANPTIAATYEDRNDGTGARCQNALSPGQQGFVVARTTVTVTAGRIDFKGMSIALAPGTPGDDDGIADAGETIDMTVTLINRSGLDVDDLTAFLISSDPKIECIGTPIVVLGSVLKNATVTSPPFRFRVAGAPTVERTTVDEILQAAFSVTVRSNKFDSLTRSIDIQLDLDMNVSGGGATTPFVEDFEGAGLGLFTQMTLDAGKNSIALSDGMRCQYNDPFGTNTNSAGNVDCFLGFTSDPAAGVNDWHIQRFNAANCNSGRAYTGTQSLRYGTCPPTATTAARDTTRFKQLDAVRTIDPINLPLASAAPELTFKHQASFVDNRNIASITAGEAVDRGVVQLQFADAAGAPVGDWFKIQAYENDYDSQGTDDFTNCTFDPTDDGSDEDDFFDPSDPLRRLGPSSTCFPEFVYARSGDTDWRFPFNVANVGLAVPGPGLEGNPAAGFRNPGTWVEPKFNLLPYAARRVRIRFLATSIELASSQTWDSLFNVDNIRGDDGWFIDDVHVDTALATPLILSVDTATLSGAACPACTSGTAGLTAMPTPPLIGPGQIVTLDAKASTFDACPSGGPQYQFWLDANGNSIAGDAGDVLVRDWTDNPELVDAPQSTTRYGVVVRCSTSVACTGSAVLVVPVNCPSTGNAKAPFGQAIAVSRTTVNWPASANVDALRGDLIALRSSGGNFTGTVTACLGNNVTATQVGDALNPGVGGAFYYLVRPTSVTFCNQAPSYGTGHPKEAAGRDAELGADPGGCP